MVKYVNVFMQSIMRIRMHHRDTTDTEKSPKQGRYEWETLRNLVQRVRDSTQLHTVPYCTTRLHNTVTITLNTLEQSIETCTCFCKLAGISDIVYTNSSVRNSCSSETYNLIYTFPRYSAASSPPNYRKRPNNEKATDDYHYEKFKKMNRRY